MFRRKRGEDKHSSSCNRDISRRSQEGNRDHAAKAHSAFGNYFLPTHMDLSRQWRDCIVIFLDLPGTKKRAATGHGGSASLRAFHRMVCDAMRNGFSSISNAYIWNDSVLLLAYLDRCSCERIMHDADELKYLLDKHIRCYAIAVKGRAFPPLERLPRRVTALRTSSYAMANCFEIEKKAKKCGLRKAWYIDARIARLVKQAQGPDSIDVTMLPISKDRQVFVHEGYLWDHAH